MQRVRAAVKSFAALPRVQVEIPAGAELEAPPDVCIDRPMVWRRKRIEQDKEAIELLELASFALPAHERTFARIP